MGDRVDEKLLVRINFRPNLILLRKDYSRMDIPDRIVSILELRRNTGERGTRKFIAYAGVVYDVTDCPKWRGDMHEALHFPGQDLSTELEEAPHAEDVFTRPCVKVVGRLAE